MSREQKPIIWHQAAWKYLAESHADAYRMLAKRIDLMHKLIAAGLQNEDKIDAYDVMNSIHLEIKREQLPAYRDVVGRMKITNKRPDYDFDKSGNIVIELRALDYPDCGVSLFYKRKLEANAATKCSVVEVEVPSHK